VLKPQTTVQTSLIDYALRLRDSIGFEPRFLGSTFPSAAECAVFGHRAIQAAFEACADADLPYPDATRVAEFLYTQTAGMHELIRSQYADDVHQEVAAVQRALGRGEPLDDDVTVEWCSAVRHLLVKDSAPIHGTPSRWILAPPNWRWGVSVLPETTLATLLEVALTHSVRDGWAHAFGVRLASNGAVVDYSDATKAVPHPA
jgi:hypothetical protein